MAKRILITGAGGQVGNALLAELHGQADLVPVDAVPLADGTAVRLVDFQDLGALRDLIRTVRPDAIVNPAAYTAVDKAESEEALALKINAEAPGVLAAEAKALGAAFVHYSTDYVFDDRVSTARREDVPTGPINAYGRTKLAGERAVLAAHPGAVILRTSWVYSHHGSNFVKTMLRLGAEREQLKVVSDQIGAPTSAAFLAAMTHRVLKAGKAGGVYHLCNSGETSWHGFACQVFKLARQAGVALKVKDVAPIPTEAYPTPTPRPRNSRLDCGKFRAAYTPELKALQTWEDALVQVVQRLTGAACLTP